MPSFYSLHGVNMPGLLESFLNRYPLGAVLESIKHSASEREARKAKSIFEEQICTNKEGQVIAEFTKIDDFPLIKFYTADPVLKAEAQAKLTAKYMLDFYISYIQFIPLAARVRSRDLLTDPISFVADEIRRRQLDFSSLEIDLYFLLIAFNKVIDLYNSDKFGPLKIESFTMDQLKALVAMCDIYKGIGCSAALREKMVAEGKTATQLIRNLDWTPLNALGSNTMGLLYPTRHQSADKPNFVFSVTFTPGLIHLSVANDKGLVITLNEATKMHSKRENKKLNAVPQFVLVRQLIENCCSVKEAIEWLKIHPPATSHILTMMDAFGGSGIFELLPNKGVYKHDLYRFRGIKEAQSSNGSLVQHTTNHFLKHNKKPLWGSEGFDCSFDRYEKMGVALAQDRPAKYVAQSTNVADTVQTLIFTTMNGKLTLKLNWANGYSASAIDSETNTLRYTHIDLTSEFKKLASQVRAAAIQPVRLSMLDKGLIGLLRSSHSLGYYQPDLGFELSRFCSQLIIDMSRGCSNNQGGLSTKQAAEMTRHIMPLVNPNQPFYQHLYDDARKQIIKDSFVCTYPGATIAIELMLGALVGLALHSFIDNGLTWAFFNLIHDLSKTDPAVLGAFMLVGIGAVLFCSESIERNFLGVNNRTFFGTKLLKEIELAHDFDEDLKDAPTV